MVVPVAEPEGKSQKPLRRVFRMTFQLDHLVSGDALGVERLQPLERLIVLQSRLRGGRVALGKEPGGEAPWLDMGSKHLVDRWEHVEGEVVEVLSLLRRQHQHGDLDGDA